MIIIWKSGSALFATISMTRLPGTLTAASRPAPLLKTSLTAGFARGAAHPKTSSKSLVDSGLISHKIKNRMSAGIPIIAHNTGLYRHTFAPSSGPNGIILNPARNTLMRAPVNRTA